MKKTRLTAVVVLGVVAIVVAGQVYADWGRNREGGGRRAGRGQNIEQRGPAYPENQGPIRRGGPGWGMQGPGWERQMPSPQWRHGVPGRRQRPYNTMQGSRDRGRADNVCPCCSAWLGRGAGDQDGVGPGGRRPAFGRGFGRQDGLQGGQWGQNWRKSRQGNVPMQQRFLRDRRQQGPARPYGDEQGFRDEGRRQPGEGRPDGWGQPQRRGMGAPGEGFGPLTPDNGDRVGPGEPPRARRWAQPRMTPDGRPQRSPKAAPPLDAPPEADNGEPNTQQ